MSRSRRSLSFASFARRGLTEGKGNLDSASYVLDFRDPYRGIILEVKSEDEAADNVTDEELSICCNFVDNNRTFCPLK